MLAQHLIATCIFYNFRKKQLHLQRHTKAVRMTLYQYHDCKSKESKSTY